MRILDNRYGNPYKILTAYRKEIRELAAVEAGDAAGFRRFSNFLVKYKSMLAESMMSIILM